MTLESMKEKSEKAGHEGLDAGTGLCCELCGSGKAKLLYPNLEKVYRCKDCGFIFSFPQPSLETLKKLYSESYFVSRQSVATGYDDYIRDEENIRRTFQKRFRTIDRFQTKPGRVLDIGCAAGFFLAVARERGWEVKGIEISDYAAAYARKSGADVYCGPLESFEPSGEKLFDVVTLWDVIEHVRQPRRDLEKIYRLLKPGGWLVLATPDVDSLTHWLFRERWMGFKDEEHLFFFSGKSMTQLLKQCGFRVVMSKFEGKYVSLDLFKRRIGCYSRNLSAVLRKFFQPQSGQNSNFYVNPFDIRMFVAQKI